MSMKTSCGSRRAAVARHCGEGIASTLYVRYKIKAKTRLQSTPKIITPKIIMDQGLIPKPQQWVVS
ncbi:hypothetical protein IVB18_45940 [Bradyrhizobium sp. 186]|uniref:hypothetical protein n=1 Tax=Bradyrhizobium sp. 186 TaxID=2782654 RepID=UPI00200123E3|nr:hypothetical protein [Bradyrhizobium sp. 186]UPK35234.1 hypothetical protein IVB18_45940 [Bradyrhizobium sp. 186]